MGAGADNLDLVNSVAIAVIPDLRPCREDEAWTGEQAQDEARLFLVLLTGASIDEVVARNDEDAVKAARAATALSQQEQKQWLSGRLAEAKRCA